MSAPRVLAVAWIPLERAKLCLDCEACYALGEPACPACGSGAWELLAKFLARRTPAWPRALDPWVSFLDVIDRLANGLTPVRFQAEGLAEILELLIELDLVANAEVHRRTGALARAIVAGIDETVARVRALAAPAPEPLRTVEETHR